MSPVTTLPPIPDQAALGALFGRNMLLTRDWTTPELETLMAVIGRFAGLDYAGKSTALFEDELGWALFFDQSTRTKSAWAGACARLGLSPVIVDGGSTQVSHGETAVETGAMLGMNSHALGVRHDMIIGEGNSFMRDVARGIDGYLAAVKDPRKVPVVNLQCDIDHPTQTLADLMWMRECNPGGLKGKKVAISWAYSPSYAKPLSVAQGCSMLFTRFGAEVVLAHPEGYHLMPDTMELRRGQRAGLGRLVPCHRTRWTRRSGRRHRLPEVAGAPTTSCCSASRPTRAEGQDEAGRDREGGAGRQRAAQGLDLRRAAHGAHPRAATRSTCTRCPPTSAPRSRTA